MGGKRGRKRRSRRRYNYKLVLIVAVAVVGVITAFYAYTALSASITGAAGGGTLSTTVSSYLSCTFSTQTAAVSFGTLAPGSTANAATNNAAGVGGATQYSVTVGASSNTAATISIFGAALVDIANAANTIAISNVKWSASTTSATDAGMAYGQATSTSMSTAATVMTVSPVAPGSSAWFRLWLNVPTGQAPATYSGSYTIQCT